MNQKQRTAILIALFLFGLAALSSILIQPLLEDAQRAARLDMVLAQVSTPSVAVADTVASAALEKIDLLQKQRGLLVALSYSFCIAGILLLAASPFLKERIPVSGIENVWGDDEWDEDD